MPLASSYLNQIATATPEHDVHKKFVDYGRRHLKSSRERELFLRLSLKTEIHHRYSVLKANSNDDKLDEENFYGDEYPNTEARMECYERHAFKLARKALDQIDLQGVTHLIVTSCTGFYAPGLDLEIIRHYRLPLSTERTIIGFMGCHAALNALKIARHIVRSDKASRILIVNLELCTLHLKPNPKLEEMMAFLIFADGCSASVVSSDPQGLEIEEFRTTLLSDSQDQILWKIGRLGFDMALSSRVPATILSGLPLRVDSLLGGAKRQDMAFWAVHPGGRGVLDAVRDGVGLQEADLAPSRLILRDFGNMSSPSIMFVLREILKSARRSGAGCALAFGPGIAVESMRFSAEANAA